MQTSVAGAESWHTSDVDEAFAIAARSYYPLIIGVRGGTFGMDLTVGHIGPLTAGLVRFSSEVDLTVEGELDSAYHFNIGIGGAIDARTGHREMVASPTSAAVYQPVGAASVRGWESGREQMLAFRIERQSLQTHLGWMLGRDVPDVIKLNPSIDLRVGYGVQFAQVARSVVPGLELDGGLPWHPFFARHLSDLIMDGLLLSGDHQYREALDRHGETAVPAAITRAMQYMDDHAHQPLSMTDVSRAVGASLRSLQLGFKRHVSLTPRQYLERARLDRVHQELRVGTPETTTVTVAATRWGFTNLGRFAASYRTTYQETPSATLRRD